MIHSRFIIMIKFEITSSLKVIIRGISDNFDRNEINETFSNQDLFGLETKLLKFSSSGNNLILEFDNKHS